MRTFDLDVACSVRAVIPDSWVQLMREQAQASDTTEFLRQAQAMHPEDDEEFALMVLKKGVRTCVQSNLRELFAASALGCTISPPSATHKDRTPPLGAVPVLPDHLG